MSLSQRAFDDLAKRIHTVLTEQPESFRATRMGLELSIDGDESAHLVFKASCASSGMRRGRGFCLGVYAKHPTPTSVLTIDRGSMTDNRWKTGHIGCCESYSCLHMKPLRGQLSLWTAAARCVSSAGVIPDGLYESFKHPRQCLICGLLEPDNSVLEWPAIVCRRPRCTALIVAFTHSAQVVWLLPEVIGDNADVRGVISDYLVRLMIDLHNVSVFSASPSR